MSSQLKNETKLFQCPSCQQTPFINFVIKTGSLNSEIKCKCGNQFLPISSLDSFLTEELKIFNRCYYCKRNNPCVHCKDCKFAFCSNCSFSHKLDHPDYKIEEVSSNKCTIHHTNINTYYCYDCQNEICVECQNTKHLYHKTNAFKEMLYIKELDEEVSKLLLQYKTIQENLLKMKNSIVNQLESYIGEVNQAYTKIKNENKELMKYIKIILKQYNILSETPSFPIISNVKSNIILNEINFREYKDAELFQYKQQILKFFSKAHFIRVKNQPISISKCKNIKTQVVHKDTINCIIKLINEKIATCSDDGVINIYSSEDYSIEKVIQVHKPLQSICQMNNEIIVACSDKEFSLFKGKKKLNRNSLEPFNGEKITKMIKLENGNILFTSGKGQIKICNFEKDKTSLIDLDLENEISNVIEIKKNVIALIQNKSLIFIDITNNKILHEIKGIQFQSNYMAMQNEKLLIFHDKGIMFINNENFSNEVNLQIFNSNCNSFYSFNNDIFLLCYHECSYIKQYKNNSVDDCEVFRLDAPGKINAFTILDNGDVLVGVKDNLVIIK